MSIFWLGYAGAIEPNITLFDILITKDVVAGEFAPEKPIDFAVLESNAGIRRFSAEYRFNRQSAAEHFTLNISVAPVGRFLDPSAYKQRRDSDAQGDTASPADYPSIGKRAQREFFGVGPGGAAYGVTFTTTDGQFDIRIIVSNLMPDGTEEPQFDLEGFARRLSERYDAKVNSKRSALNGMGEHISMVANSRLIHAPAAADRESG